MGLVTFLSEVYGGRSFEAQITRESGFVSNRTLWTGDQILVEIRGRGSISRSEKILLEHVISIEDILNPPFIEIG